MNRAASTLAVVLSLLPRLAWADEDTAPTDAPPTDAPPEDAAPAGDDGNDDQKNDGLPDPDRPVARADAEDLRGGHFFIRAGGGVLTPSAAFVPRIAELGAIDVGGGFNAELGVGLNRYLVLGLRGGMALFPAFLGPCADCGVTSIDVGLDIATHFAQGFALDPWASFGAAYRHSIIGLSSRPNVTAHILEFTRLRMGADYFPTASFGLGPYVELDVGARNPSSPSFYAMFQAGLRLSFDPPAIGTSFVPGGETTARR